MIGAVYSVFCLSCAIFISYTMRWQGATLYWGRKITLDNPIMPRGSQDAITPPAQSARIYAVCLLVPGIVVAGVVLFPWYMVVVAFIATILGSGSVGVLFMPSYESSYFRERIRRSMLRRFESCKKSGDKLRALMMQELVEALDVASGNVQ